MGSGIAALAASAGLPVVLLDLPGESDRNSVVKGALQKALKAKPSPFMDVDLVSRITTGNTGDNLDLLSTCDWIVEAIIERPDAKRALYERIEALRRPHAIVSSNTSGIPIASLCEGRGREFKSHFLGTHFFNPPRYLHLLELIPTPHTAPDVLSGIRSFAERMLGKGVVIAKDVPGFIANRLGLFGLVTALRLMEDYGLTIDEVDALTGPLIGRPKSATFRTSDISGLDVLTHVSGELSRTTGEDFSLPAWVNALVAAGQLGEKSGGGFYRKAGKDIQTLDWTTGAYHPQQTPDFPELTFLAALPLEQRLHALTTAGGKHAEFLRAVMLRSAHYTLQKTPELAHDVASVDRAMEWGYAWEMGPYRQFDAIGVDFLRRAFKDLGLDEPRLLSKVREGFYRELNSGPRQLTFSGEYAPIEAIPGHIELDRVRTRIGTVAEIKDAAVLDLGDGVLLLEFRGKMNTLDDSIMRLLDAVLERVTNNGYVGVVIGNEGPKAFTAGANLSQLLQQAKDGSWRELDEGVRAFQRTVTSLARVPFPVVVAPFGLTLGGGAELALHAARVQAHAELYLGLVEVGVGLIPAGGGTKQLLFRFTRELTPYDDADPFEAVKRAFKLITMATTSSSALEARNLGLLRAGDRITMNRNRLIADAKQRVLELVPDYAAPAPRTIRALGREALGNLEYAVWAMHEAKYITDHEVTIARKVANVLAGGDGPPRDVTEQDILDLERDAFLSLLGTPQTQERIAHTLKTGKPLRN
jgi:3-hydroxyacyl-CoA dehydrogenase